MSKLLTVESKPSGPTKKNKPAKDRTFSVHLLALITARDIWEGGNTKGTAVRPVLVMYAQTESAVRAFTANLRGGRSAQLINREGSYSRVDGSVEFLSRVPYRWAQQKIEGAVGARGEPVVVVTAYNPEIFQLEPGMIDPENCTFVIAPPDWWTSKQNEWLNTDEKLVEQIKEYCRVLDLAKIYNLSEEVMASLVPRAAYFMAYLNNRTKLALPISLEFQLQVYLAALKKGIAKFWYDQRPENMSFASGTSSHYFSSEGTDKVGMSAAVLCQVSQEDLAAFLEAQCKFYKTANDRLNEKYPERASTQVERRLEQYRRAAELSSAVRQLESRFDEPVKAEAATELDVEFTRRHKATPSNRHTTPRGPLQDEGAENFSFDYLDGMEVEPVLIDEIPEHELDLVEDYVKPTPPVVEDELTVEDVMAEVQGILDPIDALMQDLNSQFGAEWNRPEPAKEPAGAAVIDLGTTEVIPNIKDGQVSVATRPRKPSRVVKDLDEAFPFGLEQMTLIFGDLEVFEVEKPVRKTGKKEVQK